MFLYDTLTEKKKKITSKSLKLFVCGPTVYNQAHIGHARTYLFFDTLVHYLRRQGFSIFYLQNITDIDDKIINRAKLQKKDPKTLAQSFEKEYLKDMKTLGIKSVDKYAKASRHLKEIRQQIAKLLKKGYAYQTDSGIYFEVRKFPRYGQLSKQNLNELRPGWRIEPDPQKKDPLDFALWKKTDADWSFASPWGKGRPGWHIEDTAISQKYLGDQYDLHGAAVDLKFPHHESEIAQQESISGKRPFVRIWLHVGFLLADNKKMSKSLNNFIAIKDFLKKYPAAVLRLIFLSHHYRSPVNYTSKLADNQQNALARINKFLRTLIVKEAPADSLIKRADKKLTSALADDFNTAKALAVIFNFINTAPKTEKTKSWVINKLADLGINLQMPQPSAKLKNLLNTREKLRRNKDFSKADKLRKEIEALGFLVED